MSSLHGKVVVIAGSSSASGRAVAERLARDGATVVALGSDAGRLEPVLAHDRRVVDLRDFDATQAVARDILSKLGRVDGLIHLVGGWRSGRDDEGWDELLARNVTTLRNTTRAFRDSLLSSGCGRFAMVSSVVTERPGWGGANYATTKAAAETWTRALARGWASEGGVATIFAVSSLGEGDGAGENEVGSVTPVAVLAEHVSGLWDPGAAELNGARVVV